MTLQGPTFEELSQVLAGLGTYPLWRIHRCLRERTHQAPPEKSMPLNWLDTTTLILADWLYSKVNLTAFDVFQFLEYFRKPENITSAHRMVVSFESKLLGKDRELHRCHLSVFEGRYAAWTGHQGAFDLADAVPLQELPGRYTWVIVTDLLNLLLSTIDKHNLLRGQDVLEYRSRFSQLVEEDLGK